MPAVTTETRQRARELLAEAELVESTDPMAAVQLYQRAYRLDPDLESESFSPDDEAAEDDSIFERGSQGLATGATPSFQANDPAWAQYLEEWGYVVIDDVADAASVSAAKDLLWDALEAAATETGCGRLCRNDASTWDDAACSWSSCISDKDTGIISCSSFAHSDFAWLARSNPTVQRVFATLWGCSPDDLITSFDVGSVFRPWQSARRLDWRTRGGWFHVDQNAAPPVHHAGRICVQGLLTYTDATAHTGGLCVIPGSHKHHTQLCTRAPPTASDFVAVPQEDQILAAPYEPPRLVTAKAGSLVLWDSRTVHCNTPGIEDAAPPCSAFAPNSLELLRIVSYVAMVPRAFASNAVLAQRVDAWEGYNRTNHCPQHPRFGSPPCGRPRRSIEDLESHTLRRLIGWTASASEHNAENGVREPSPEAMAAMEAANACEAAGNLKGAKEHLAEAERLGHTFLKEHGGWR